jgi:hypothetical protein
MSKEIFIKQASQVGWRILTTVILTLSAVITVWCYAAFIEPVTGPNSSDQDFSQNILGANNTDNDFNSSAVIANEDGSIIERLEKINENIDMAPDEKAMIAAEQFTQIPTFETWDGFVSRDQVLNPSVDDYALMASRHPWASAWNLVEDGSSTAIGGPSLNPSALLRTSAVSDNVVQLTCLRPYKIGFPVISSMATKDERLIFELIVKPEGYAGTGVNMDWFVGMVENQNPGSLLTTPELASYTAQRRWGFAIDNDDNIYGIAVDGFGGEVTPDKAITPASVQHLKAVYDIGTGI